MENYRTQMQATYSPIHGMCRTVCVKRSAAPITAPEESPPFLSHGHTQSGIEQKYWHER